MEKIKTKEELLKIIKENVSNNSHNVSMSINDIGVRDYEDIIYRVLNYMRDSIINENQFNNKQYILTFTVKESKTIELNLPNTVLKYNMTDNILTGYEYNVTDNFLEEYVNTVNMLFKKHNITQPIFEEVYNVEYDITEAVINIIKQCCEGVIL